MDRRLNRMLRWLRRQLIWLGQPGGSLAEDLAKAGFVADVMNARGCGGSTKPKAMDQPPDENRPLSRAYEGWRDIQAVVREVQHCNSTSQIALFGWGTG